MAYEDEPCGWCGDVDCTCELADAEEDRDEFVLVCGVEGCLMPGYHFRSECHTVEDVLAYEAYAERFEAERQRQRHAAKKLETSVLGAFARWLRSILLGNPREASPPRSRRP